MNRENLQYFAHDILQLEVIKMPSRSSIFAWHFLFFIAFFIIVAEGLELMGNIVKNKPASFKDALAQNYYSLTFKSKHIITPHNHHNQ